MKKIFLIFGVVLFVSLFVASSAKAITVEELSAQIAQLQAQIAALQIQLGQLQGQPSAWCHDFNVNLSYGSSGSDVKELRSALEKEGFPTTITFNPASFDEGLASAVSGFQEKYKSEILTPLGLRYPTGYVGKATREKLNKLYGCIKPICIQVLTPAKNPVDNQCKVFPTPCDVPTGWIKVSSCPITTPSITVLSPNGGETLEIGKTYQINWKASPDIAKVGIYLLPAGKVERTTILPGIVNTGKYDWKIPATVVLGQYTIFIRNTTDWGPDASDESDNFFNIVSAATVIPVYSIEPQSVLTRGLTYTLTGKISDGLSNSIVKFYLQRPDGVMEYSGITVAPSGVVCLIINCPTVTDANGYFAYQIKITIPKEGQNGTWISWVTVGGVESNKLSHNVSPAVQSKGSLLLALSPETPLSQTIVPGATYSFIKFKLTADEFEDIKVNSLSAHVYWQPQSMVKPYDISDIKLYDGSILLASGQTEGGSNGYAYIPFRNLNLIIPRAGSKTLTIKAAISINEASSFRFEIFGSDLYDLHATGLSSGASIESSGHAVGNTMNFEKLKPNLTVSGIKFYPAGKTDTAENEIALTDMHKYVGARVVAKAVMANTGASFATIFNVKWFLNGAQVSYSSHSGMTANEVSNGNVRFDWTVKSGGYEFKFTADADNHVAETNESDNSFNLYFIVPIPSITVVSPNGGEVWYAGETKTITWKSSSVDHVQIYLENLSAYGPDSSIYLTPNNDPVPASAGVFGLTVPIVKDGELSYKIRIVKKEDVVSMGDNPSVSDTSDMPFVIVNK